MKVLQILQRKGSNEVETVSADATLADVVTRLSEKKIGCVLILKNGSEVAGIVSERDIVRALGEAGSDCLSNDITSVMTANVITCSTQDDDNSVLNKMTIGRFRHIPVMDGEKLAGLISIGDVVKARIDSLQSENEELENMIRAATA